MITLFRPSMQFEMAKPYAPRNQPFFEDVKPYAHPGYDPADDGVAGLRGLGNIVEDIIGPVAKGVTDIVDTVTGAKATREAQQRAVELQTAQYNAQVATTQARAAQFATLGPWLGLAVVGVGLVVAVAILKK